jgi:hypothetical protein
MAPRQPGIILIREVSATIAEDPHLFNPDISLVMTVAQGRKEVLGRQVFVLLKPADIDAVLANSPEAVQIIRAALQRHDAARQEASSERSAPSRI